jgi:hypothetical protein
MTKNKQEVSPPAPENPETPPLNALVGQHVMHTLGRPADLHTVQVRRLWEDRYRVNVLTGRDATSVKFTHSYFLVVDTAGAIVTSTPAITRQY